MTTTQPPPKRQKRLIAPEVRDEILRLHEFYGTRQIALRVGESRKIVRRVLADAGLGESPRSNPLSKLDPFLEVIQERVVKRLTISRIHREIREVGYVGRRTILAQYVRKLRIDLAIQPPPKRVRRRFETDAGREMQVDWSPFRLLIADRQTPAHALTIILGHSRRLFLAFFRDERQPSLLEGLARAFQYFDGCATHLVLDNMSTAVLGRHGPDRKPIWHPTFLAFVRHYGIQPVACAVRDPDRKGKIEKPFRLVFDDFLKNKTFRSWDDLEQQAAQWLDHTPGAGNQRVHGTTGQVPHQAHEEERPFLIRLPAEACPVHEDALRIVDNDCTLSIVDRRYTVPSSLANTTVSVRLFGHHFEVLDRDGRIAFSRRYAGPDDKRRLIIDRTHFAALPRRPKGAHDPERLDEAFIRRFPELRPFVEGLKVKMKTLAGVHVRRLILLADQYGQPAFVAAATRAQAFRRFDSIAVARILERDHPEPAGNPVGPLGGNGATLVGEVDAGSLDRFAALDDVPTSSDAPHDPHPFDTEDEEAVSGKTSA